MTQKNQIHKCDLCGNIVEVVHTGASVLICCGQEMRVLEGNTVDAAKEKHVPVIEKIDKGVKICVGSVAHPMEEKHFIEWIEILTDGVLYRKELKPGDEPIAEFCIDGEITQARAYCNLHELWKT